MTPDHSFTYGSVNSESDSTDKYPGEPTVLINHAHADSSPNGIRKNVGSDDDYYYCCCTWKEYFNSWRFLELAVCVLPFLIAGIYFESGLVKPRMRPIPYQKILTNDEISPNADESLGYQSYTNIVWNEVNAAKDIGETVGHRQYQILFGLCPWLFQLALVWFLAAKRRRNHQGLANNFQLWDDLHRTTCLYFVGIGTTDFITNSVKFYAGYFRPVFLDICKPYYDETDSAFHCSNQTWDSLNARISFPSNHSSWSFCGMLLFSMYLDRCFGLGSIQGNRANSFETKGVSKKEQFHRKWDRQSQYRLTSFVCYAPVLIAFFVAASRVTDNRHFPADVVGGAVLGGSVAMLTFSIWFPQHSALLS